MRKNELVGIEKDVYLYAYCVKQNGYLMDNREIASELGISEDYLLEVLEKINKKIRTSIYTD